MTPFCRFVRVAISSPAWAFAATQRTAVSEYCPGSRCLVALAANGAVTYNPRPPSATLQGGIA